MKRIVAREDFCLGCRLCEIHCLVQHSKSKKLIKAFRKERDMVVPGVQVEQEGYVSFALQCRHCDEAPCIEACMTGAMHRDPDSDAVLCDEEVVGSIFARGAVDILVKEVGKRDTWRFCVRFS